jgi:ribosomal protein S18 acetylase RimI-like enzyme
VAAKYTRRATLDDLDRLKALLQRDRLARGSRCTIHTGDLFWGLYYPWRPESEIQRIGLWENSAAPDGALAGFAWFDPFWPAVSFVTDPAADGPGLIGQMIEWGEHFLDGVPHPGMVLRIGALEDDAPRIALLEAHGYVRGNDTRVFFGRPLNGEIEAPEAPPGFAVREGHYPAELEARMEAQHAAFESTLMNAERYATLRTAHGYVADLDVVAMAPDGACASFCLGWPDEVTGMAQIEPMATHPAYQRRGLGRAVLYEAFRRMQARGMRWAIVETAGENTPALRLYESVGFRVAAREVGFYKGIRDDGPAGLR